MAEGYVTLKVTITDETEAILRQIAVSGFDSLRSGRPDYGKAIEAILEVALRATADPSRKPNAPTVWQQQVAKYKASRAYMNAHRKAQRDLAKRHRSKARKIT